MSALDRTGVLRARARALAQEPTRDAPAQEELELIEFIVADERYAVESCHVDEVHPLKELTPLPGTPPFVLGIVNIRGLIFSVIDIRKFFELPDGGLSDLNKVIVLRDRAMAFGILADRVEGSGRLARSRLQASLPTFAGIREQYLKGLTADRLVVLAADKLLSDPRIVINQEIEERSKG